jgi:Leucine-rich repeat (LRR) protein
MAFCVESYLASLPEDILEINIIDKDLRYLPDLTRFKKLEILNCRINRLKSLPKLPKSLKQLICANNRLTSIPELPENLNTLNCSQNLLKYLPNLPKNLQILNCSFNLISVLPILPKSLKNLSCYNNDLIFIPNLPDDLRHISCHSNELINIPILPNSIYYMYINYKNNPIYDIIHNDNFDIVKRNIIIINKFRHLYYCIKFRDQFRKLLWEKIREPKIVKKYGPNYLIKHLGDDADLDKVLDEW